MTALLLLLLLVPGTRAQQCQYTSPSGETIDLSPLNVPGGHQVVVPPDDPQVRLVWQPCSARGGMRLRTH